MFSTLRSLLGSSCLRLVTLCESPNNTFSGIFLYLLLVLELGHVSIELSQFRVLCVRAAKQILLCLGAVSVVIVSFALAITALIYTVPQPVSEEAAHANHQWADTGTIFTTLTQMALGVMDLSEIHGMVEYNPLLFVTWISGDLRRRFFENHRATFQRGLYSDLAAVTSYVCWLRCFICCQWGYSGTHQESRHDLIGGFHQQTGAVFSFTKRNGPIASNVIHFFAGELTSFARRIDRIQDFPVKI